MRICYPVEGVGRSSETQLQMGIHSNFKMYVQWWASVADGGSILCQYKLRANTSYMIITYPRALNENEMHSQDLYI